MAKTTRSREYYLNKYIYNSEFYKELRKLNKTGNVVIIVVGKPDTGKSNWSYFIAWLLDDGFNSERIRFKLQDIIKLVIMGIQGKLSFSDSGKIGPFVMFDDAGLGYGRKKWQSVFNQALSLILQSFRMFRINLIFTVPDDRLMDRGPEDVMGFYVVMQKKGEAKVYLTRFDHFKKIPKKTRFMKVTVPKVPDDLWKEYEDAKRAFLLEKYQTLDDELETLDAIAKAKTIQKKRTYAQWVGWIAQNYRGVDGDPDRRLFNMKGKLDVGLVMMESGLEDRGYVATLVSAARERYSGIEPKAAQLAAEIKAQRKKEAEKNKLDRN